MGRIHAFEFEDLRWFPNNLRNYATDFLQVGAKELHEMINQLKGHEQFTWEVGIAKGKPVHIGYLLGIPRK